MEGRAFELGLGPLNPLGRADAGARVEPVHVEPVRVGLVCVDADAHGGGDDAGAGAGAHVDDAEGGAGAPGVGGGGPVVEAGLALLAELASGVEFASDFELVSAVEPALLVEPVVVAAAVVAGVDAGVDAERGPGSVGVVLGVGLGPDPEFDLAGLVLWLALRLRLPPVEQRHQPYEDGREDVLYRTALMRLVCEEPWVWAERSGPFLTCVDGRGVSFAAPRCHLD